MSFTGGLMVVLVYWSTYKQHSIDKENLTLENIILL